MTRADVRPVVPDRLESGGIRRPNEWIAIRAGHVRVRKGRPGVARLREIRALTDLDGFPTHTASWVTRSRQLHFKPDFPHPLRQPLRDLML